LHGGFGDPVMHIPLIVVLPPSMEQPTTKRVSALTQGIDVAPTILDLCNINPDYRRGLAAKGQGQSLLPAMHGGAVARADPEELFFIHVVLRGRDEISRFKYVFSEEQPVFYDLDADPDEKVNLLLDPEWAAANAERVEGIRVQLWERRDNSVRLYNAVIKGTPVAPVPEMTAEQVEELEALGYFEGGEEEDEGK